MTCEEAYIIIYKQFRKQKQETMSRNSAFAMNSFVCTTHGSVYRVHILKPLIILSLLLLFFTVIKHVGIPAINGTDVMFREPTRDRIFKSDSVHIGVVICGNRLEEGTVMLKSAFIFSKTELVFHIFTEDKLRKDIENEIHSWRGNQSHRLKIYMYNIQYPFPKSCPTCSPSDWRKLFRPCATQRLFIPGVLTDVDSLIYMDTDTLFLSPIENVWATLSLFSPYQMVGVVREQSGWYDDKSFPYCTQTGVNSGVMLMNLTRLRAVQWMDQMVEYYSKYRKHLQLGDQDLINIYCHFHPGLFYIMSCSFNYRGIFCPSQKPCSSPGAYILHGNSMAFHNNIFPVVKSVYRSIKEYDHRKHSLRDLLDSMLSKIKQHSDTACAKLPHVFTRNLGDYVKTNEQNKGG